MVVALEERLPAKLQNVNVSWHACYHWTLMDGTRIATCLPQWNAVVFTELAPQGRFLASAKAVLGSGLQGPEGHTMEQFAKSVLGAEDHPDPYRDLRNALLYADHVYWIPVELVIAALSSFLESGGDPTRAEPKVHQDAPQFAELIEEIKIAGAGPAISAVLDLPLVFQALMKAVESFNEAIGSGAQDVNTAVAVLLPAMRSSLSQVLMPQMTRAIGDSRALLHSGGIFKPSAPTTISRRWDAYKAAACLTGAMSDLLLPEVSLLPLEAILDLRSRLADSLNPMRAEMLRLTEALRQMVMADADEATIRAEARNLIATRVEPVVRETAQRANEMALQKWRKLYRGAAKALGFAGAAFVSPSMIGKALGQTVETAALIAEDPDDSTFPAKATAQFVLLARTFLSDNQPQQ